MTRSRVWTTATLLGVGLLCVLSLPVDGSSAALFTSRSSSTATVGSAADWTPPTVTMTQPPAVVTGTVTVAAQATDGETGVASVTIQYFRAGGSGWTTICTDSTAPYSCAWSTTNLSDGDYSLRAIALDKAGYAATSATVSTAVANSAKVFLDNPGEAVRATVTMTGSIANPGLLITWVYTVQYRKAGSTDAWTDACVDYVAPYACSWNTAGLTNGEDYEVQAMAEGYLTLIKVATHYSTSHEVTVDNVAPTVAMENPGSPLRGTVTLAATAADEHTGVDRVVIQRQRTGTTGWTDVCTTGDEPFRCRLDTTALADGGYSFRAVATDLAGNSTTSAAITNRLVDNTVSSVSLDDPGTELAGTVTLQARVNTSATGTKVLVQRKVSGGADSTYADLCTLVSAPYTCEWSTSTVVNGSYDLRAVLLDATGKVLATSPVLAGRKVDNAPLRGVDVQATNGGGTAGRLEAGDAITFTYNRLVQLASISTGWSGAALPVTLRLRDGNSTGLQLGANGDLVDVLRGGAQVNLGAVNLRGDYVKNKKAVTFAATMTATTITLGGVDATRVTITLGALATGSGLRTAKVATMVWAPSPSAQDQLTTSPCATTPVVEPGPGDKDF